jgi:cephalosporin-C deacetylase-like acetyl esterase
MQNDLYTKTVLTLIAVALSMIALNPWIAPERVEAAAASQDGVITAIACNRHPNCKRELPER